MPEKNSECAYFPSRINHTSSMVHRDNLTIINDTANQSKHLVTLHLRDESKRLKKKLFFKLRVRSEVTTFLLLFPDGRGKAPSTDRSPWKYVNEPLSRSIIPRKSLPSTNGSRRI